MYNATSILCRNHHWPSELISTGTDNDDHDDDDITSILSVYCHLLIEKHTGNRKFLGKQ